MLSEDERARFERIARELNEDQRIARLDRKTRRRVRARSTMSRRQRLVQWAERRFYDRLSKQRGW